MPKKVLKIRGLAREVTLLEKISKRSTEELPMAHLSFSKFISRYGGFIRHLIRKKIRYAKEDESEIFQIFLCHVWEKSHLYCPFDGEGLESKETLSWLSWQLLPVLRTYEDGLLQGSSKYSHVSLEDIEPYKTGDFRQLITDQESEDVRTDEGCWGELLALGIVSEKELDILRSSLLYPVHIPKEERSRLCNKYKITEKTLRTAKFKAKKKITDYWLKSDIKI